MASIVRRSLPLVVGLKPGEGAARGSELYIISVVMLVIAGLFVLVRITTRLLTPNSNGHGIGQDDYCVIAALISSVGLSITEIEATVAGYGNHISDLTKSQIHLSLEWFYAAQIMYKVVITLNKCALLLFYLRIFPHPRFRKLCYAGLAFVALSGVAYIGATIFQCTPIAYMWNRTLPGGHCLESAPFWISYATINIVTDFYILVLPMPLLFKLTLTNKNKWGVIACFAMGGFVCFTTIIRMTTLARCAKGTDFTYGPVPATNWSVIEANTGLICTCMPMLRQYRRIKTYFLGPGPIATRKHAPNTPRSDVFRRTSYKTSALEVQNDVCATSENWDKGTGNTMDQDLDQSRPDSQENTTEKGAGHLAMRIRNTSSSDGEDPLKTLFSTSQAQDQPCNCNSTPVAGDKPGPRSQTNPKTA